MTIVAAAAALGLAGGAATAQTAEITVGLSTAMTGPISSIGIPYARGMAAAHA